MGTAVRLRPATIADAAELAALAGRTFRDTFAPDNALADVEAYVREALSLGRVTAELADPASHFVLAATGDGGTLLGYSKLCANAAEMCVAGPDPIEIERIYVDRPALGHGVGAALMQRCLDDAQAMGRRTVWLGVWERNGRAIAFYERWGFRIVGEHVFQLGSDAQRDLIMERHVHP